MLLLLLVVLNRNEAQQQRALWLDQPQSQPTENELIRRFILCVACACLRNHALYEHA